MTIGPYYYGIHTAYYGQHDKNDHQINKSTNGQNGNTIEKYRNSKESDNFNDVEDKTKRKIKTTKSVHVQANLN